MQVTRVAPTPSGYVHAGNAVNFVLTSWLARATDGQLLLRVDDVDTDRARPEYLDDIVRTLDWLGITPTDPGWAMSQRPQLFRAALDRLRRHHPQVVFTCRCSRRELSADGACRAGCRTAGHPEAVGRTAVRLHVPGGLTAGLGGHQHPVPPGDHVLWRRDGLPAYQLASVAADAELGVTAVVRGVDLLDSSALQWHIATLLGLPGFLTIDFRHHRLLTAPDGGKLSKSAGSQAHPMPRTAQARDEILLLAGELGAPIGITPP